MWSLIHAIKTNPGGVADPIQLMTLRLDERGVPVIEEFEEAELQEHRQLVSEAEEHLSSYRHEQAEEPPTPPPAAQQN